MASPLTIHYYGQDLTVTELAKRLNISPQGLRYRIKKGLPLKMSEFPPIITYRERLRGFEEWCKKFNYTELGENEKLVFEWIVERVSDEIASQYRQEKLSQKCIGSSASKTPKRYS